MSRFLNEFTDFIRVQGKYIFSVTEIHDGVSETVQLRPAPRCQNTYSISKMFTTTAIGFLYDEGKISPDDHVADILRDELPEGMDPRWETVTVDWALRHRIGLPDGYLDIDVAGTPAFGKDFLANMLTAPLVRDPGTEFGYTDAAFYLLARVVEKISGEPVDDFLSPRLFWPLGFEEAAWSKDPQGHPMGATGLYISTGDIAKLGELYRCGGMWKGTRILSEDWCRRCVEAPYELYAFSDNCYGKGGMYGQMMMVVPSAKRVVAWSAFEDDCGPMLRFVSVYKD